MRVNSKIFKGFRQLSSKIMINKYINKLCNKNGQKT